MFNRIILILHELDWNTPLRRVKLHGYWRIYLLMCVFALPAFGVWWILFPHTFWFMRLWGAFATGGMVGMVFGHLWHLAEPMRRAMASGQHLVFSMFIGWIILLPTALLLVGPQLHGEEIEVKKLWSLKESDVKSIGIQRPDEPQLSITDHMAIVAFVNRCHVSTLFYPSHESITNKARLTIHFVDGMAWPYEASIPERHPEDLELTFRASNVYSHILIPGAAKWYMSQDGTDSRRDEGRHIFK